MRPGGRSARLPRSLSAHQLWASDAGSVQRLDRDQAGVLGTPDVDALFEGQEADRLVERSGSLVLLGIPRWTERLDLKQSDSACLQLALNHLKQVPTDTLSVQRTLDGEQLDLGCDRCVATNETDADDLFPSCSAAVVGSVRAAAM